MTLTKIITGIKLMTIYLRAKLIVKMHYDEKYIKSSRSFCGGKYGSFTASGWRWLINDYVTCKKMRVNRDIPWPVSPQIRIVYPENIIFHPDDLNNFQGFGNYFQAIGHITIGHGTYIAPNVGIITSNHNIENLDKHDESKPITLGERCWIGMNSVILPGVTLGEHTVVGAGSVVTKSFPDGHCVIAGNPAIIIRSLDGGKT